MRAAILEFIVLVLSELAGLSDFGVGIVIVMEMSVDLMMGVFRGRSRLL